MASVRSAIKAAAPAPRALDRRRHDDRTGAAADTDSDVRPILTSNQPSSSSRTRALGTSPHSTPRSPGLVDVQAETQGRSSTTSRAAQSGKRTSRHSQSSATATQARGRERERNPGSETNTNHAGDAAEAPENDAGIGSGAGTGSNSGLVRSELPTPTPPLAESPTPASAIDPLSQHIYLRTHPDQSAPPRRRAHPRADSPPHAAEGLPRQSSDVSAKNATPAGDGAKDKKKGGSFLSRLSMRGSKKKDGTDSESELGSEARTEGVNARVFSQSMAGSWVGGGYIPHHKEPPRYIRTSTTNKKIREFNRMFLAQELVGTRPPKDAEPGKTPLVSVSVAGSADHQNTQTGGAIWAAEFSKDGRYLATAGRDHVVRVWAVLSTPEDRRAHELDEAAKGGARERLSAPVFRDQPVREFEGHTGEVLDLTWSKNNFLLSSSMDKTVRLWHMSRNESLCTFRHKDFVTRLAFHPRDDRFFLAGSLDTMLRLWSIPDKAIAFSAQLPDLVTAVGFSPDGKTAIAGLLNGLCLFYETEGLKLQTQIHVRSSRGKNAKGSKITGIQTMSVPPPKPPHIPSSRAPSPAPPPTSDVEPQGEVRVLITSNDSRIRIYSLNDKSLTVKLKGHENLCSQIAATFSDDGKYVICGSEDRKAFVWNLDGNALTQDKDKPPCESFEAHGEMVTTALFAPTKTRMLLGLNGDPIYDLCNPPPVVLQSLEEAASAAASQVALSVNGSYAPGPSESTSKRPELSPGYIARSTHYDGNIIITTGDSGIIKVFRQDCAFPKRRHDNWETGSTFSRKLTSHGGGFISNGLGLGRSVSIMTRTSGGSVAHSRRGSLSHSIPMGSPQIGVTSGGSSDRILSWRQGIEHGERRGGTPLANGGGTPARSERSLSPTKPSRTPLGSSAANLASESRKNPYSSLPTGRPESAMTSPSASVFSASFSSPPRAPTRLSRVNGRDDSKRPGSPDSDEEPPSVPPTPSFTFRPANEDAEPPQGEPAATGGGSGGGGSHSFWNLNRWRGITTGFRASSSGSQTGIVGTGGKAKSAGSRDSMSKTRGRTEGSSDERERERGRELGGVDPDRETRRKSTGIGPAVRSVDDDDDNRRRSVPPPARREGATTRMSSDSADGGRTARPVKPVNPVQLRRDGSPYRHLWADAGP